MEILKDLVIILLSGVLVVGLTQLIRIPSVVGFIITGILIGPGGFHLIHNTRLIDMFSEIGVMFLMFTIGLEFSLKKIFILRKEVLGIGGFQMACTVGIAWIVFASMSISTGLSGAAVVAFAVSMSSTAMVLKYLKENGKIQTPYGRTMTGVLLFQDICVVPFLIIIPLMAKHEMEPLRFIQEILLSFGGMALVFGVAKVIVPKFFNLIYPLKTHELFFIMVLCACFGMAISTASLGFSLSLGSFIAGMILSESDFIYQIESEVHSLKNFFLSLFFISIGLLLRTDHLFAHPVSVLSDFCGIVLVKTLVITLILLFFRYPANFSLMIGLGLSQIGEFSFILLNEAYNLHIIPENFYQNMLSASVLSMMFTPGFLYLGNRVLQRDLLQRNIRHQEKHSGQVIIGGFGITGQNIARILKALQVPYVVIEYNPNTVKKFRNSQEPIVFGDITNRNNILQLGGEKASMLLIALSDWDASLRAVRVARRVNPKLKIIVRTEFVSQIQPLYHAGADIVISQEFESSLEMAYHVMRNLHIPDFVARFNSRQLRKKHYSFFKDDILKVTPIRLSEISSFKIGLEVFMIPRDSRPEQVCWKDEFSRFPNIHILGIIRSNEIIKNIPPESFTFLPCDLIILTGPSVELDILMENLNKKF